MINARSFVTTYHYDVAGRKDHEIDPLARRITYTYDAVGNLTVKEDACGNTVTNEYDANNRLTTETYTGGRVHTFTYDPVGNRKTAWGPAPGGGTGTYITTYTARDEVFAESVEPHLDEIQSYLDFVSLIDPTGISDLVNAGIYLARGEFVLAGLSGLGAIPAIGLVGSAAVIGAKSFGKGIKLAGIAGDISGIGRGAMKATGNVASDAGTFAHNSNSATRLARGGDNASSAARRTCPEPKKGSCFVAGTQIWLFDDVIRDPGAMFAELELPNSAELKRAGIGLWLAVSSGVAVVLVGLKDDRTRRSRYRVRLEEADPDSPDTDGETDQNKSIPDPECWENLTGQVVQRSGESMTFSMDQRKGHVSQPVCGPLEHPILPDERMVMGRLVRETVYETAGVGNAMRETETSRMPTITYAEESADVTIEYLSGHRMSLPGNKSVTEVATQEPVVEFGTSTVAGFEVVSAPSENWWYERWDSLPAFVRWMAIAAVTALTVGMVWNHNRTAVRSTPGSMGPRPVQYIAAPATSTLTTTSIENIRVGMRVPADNPEGDSGAMGMETEFGNPDPATWRDFEFLLRKEDGGELRMHMLRPVGWYFPDHTGPLVDSSFIGQQIEMVAGEIAVGTATITAVNSCPEIQPGPGRIVTATYAHSSARVVDLKFSNQAGEFTQTIGSTANHPFWSVDRQEFVEAGELRLEERVTTLDGQHFRLTSITPRAGPEPVYNFEVALSHVYHVGAGGLLVHNSTNCGPDGSGSNVAKGNAREARQGIVTVYLDDAGRHVGIEVDGIARHLVMDAITKKTSIELMTNFDEITDFVRIKVDDLDAVANFIPTNIGTKFAYGQNSCVSYVKGALESGGATGINELANTLRQGFWDALNVLHVW